MELYANLSPEEKELLIQFPAYLSLLAANADGKLDEREKEKARELAHIKRYDNKEPLLIPYYRDVEAHFERDLLTLDAQLPRDREQREQAIRQQLGKIEGVLHQMGAEYNNAMHRSVIAFKDFVSKAHENTLEHFVFPFPIKGLTE